MYGRYFVQPRDSRAPKPPPHERLAIRRELHGSRPYEHGPMIPRNGWPNVSVVWLVAGWFRTAEQHRSAMRFSGDEYTTFDRDQT